MNIIPDGPWGHASACYKFKNMYTYCFYNSILTSSQSNYPYSYVRTVILIVKNENCMLKHMHFVSVDIIYHKALAEFGGPFLEWSGHRTGVTHNVECERAGARADAADRSDKRRARIRSHNTSRRSSPYTSQQLLATHLESDDCRLIRRAEFP